MQVRDKSFALDERDRQVLQSTLSIINNILLRNNLNMRGVVVDTKGRVVVDSADIYEDLSRGRMFVSTREPRG